ncbi:L-threonylcarbamoyladenylate synthase [Magnetofaba australis]
MSQFFTIHPDNPQPRLINQAVSILNQGGVIVYPTDTTYGLGCLIDNRKGIERITQIKRLANNHQLTMLCADLSQISEYAMVDNQTYRLLKRFLPGPYTFVLDATREAPKSMLTKRKTIGLRVPDHAICHALLEQIGKPLLSTSLKLPGEEILSDPVAFRSVMEKRVDLIIDGGVLPEHPSTVVDLTGGAVEVLRVGSGDPAPFQ